jgi:hypothetical protein
MYRSTSTYAANMAEKTANTEHRYKADITAGALKLHESRVIADLLLRQVDAASWKHAIVTKNVLQARNPGTARRLTKLIRARLETMGPDLWALVRDANGGVATQAVFAAAVKHSYLLGDFLQIAVAEQYRLFSTALTNKLWDDYRYQLGCDSGTAAAALSHAIGSDSQRPFAIVIVGGLISGLLLSIFLLPTLYAWVARDGDVLPPSEDLHFEETH